MKNQLANTATAVLALCALTMTGLVVRRELQSQPSEAAELDVREVDGWESLAGEGHLIGNPNAPVKIVEFSDFECPFCAEAHSTLQEIRKRYGGQVAVVYRHFPLPRHPNAFRAALATECAAEQNAFESYHNLLFQQRDSIGVTAWDDLADRAGVKDLGMFRQCMEEQRFRDRVLRDERAGKALGIRGTPAFVVRERLLTGSYPMDVWDKELSRILPRP
jgi:protein-disulfide isomerase